MEKTAYIILSHSLTRKFKNFLNQEAWKCGETKSKPNFSASTFLVLAGRFRFRLYPTFRVASIRLLFESFSLFFPYYWRELLNILRIALVLFIFAQITQTDIHRHTRKAANTGVGMGWDQFPIQRRRTSLGYDWTQFVFKIIILDHHHHHPAEWTISM